MLRHTGFQRPIIRQISPVRVSTAILCPGKEYGVQGPIYIGSGGAGKQNFEAYLPILRILAILFALGVIWSQRYPLSIKAQNGASISLENLLTKAETSRAIERWSNAANYYEQALA